MTSRYEVSEHTQVNLDGKLYGPGDEVNLDPDRAAPLVAAGQLEKVSAKR